MKLKQIVGEHKKGVRAVKYNAKPQTHIEPPKPRNFVAKNATTSGAGAHKDKKKAAKQGEVKHKAQAVAMGEGHYNRRDAYQRDYDSSQTGFDRPGRDWDEGDKEPPNNFAIYINGKKWKVFPGHGYHADDHRERAQYQHLKDMCARKSAATGKKWSVHVTGENPTESVQEGEGKVTAVDPAKGVEITNPQTGVKTTIPPKMTSALAPDKANPDRYTLNPQAVTGGDQKDTATGPKVGSQVAIPDQATEEDMLSPVPADSTSPIHGGTVDGDEAGNREHDEIIHLLKHLAGVREMDNGPVSVQTGIRSDLGQMKKMAGL